MKLLLSLLCSLSAATAATAQLQVCLPPNTWVCTNTINYAYDAVGNRVLRSQYCYCAGVSSRYANTKAAADSTKAVAAATDGAAAKSILAIYPNPTNSSITVEFSEAVTGARVGITNNLGQEILSVPVSGSTATIDLAAYPVGVYTVTLYDTDSRTARRVAKVDK